MSKAQHFKDGIVQHSVHRQRDQFVNQLRSREKDILKLASTKCGKPSASFFQSTALGDYHARGSYNVSFFIRFADGEKCVFRVPLRPCLAYCPRLKLQCEVATMQHLSESTTIPVPKVLAYCADSGADPLSTFMILEYIDGKLLSPAEFRRLPPDPKAELYKSLADVFVQLRRQEFPSIGRLKLGASGVRIGEKTASLEMNMMQLEGLDPFSIQDSHHDKSGTLKSANSYTRMLLSVGYNAFLKSRNAVAIGMGLECLYSHFLFCKHVQKWVDPDLDQGPFVLVHGDLHLSNLLVDHDMRIIGVLDWEWSRVVPVQYFAPPFWLSGKSTVQLAGPNSWQLFLEGPFADFLAEVKTREGELFKNNLLYDEWTRRTEYAEPLVANALENWTDVDWFVHRYLASKEASSANDTLSAFADEDPLRSLLADIKEQDHRKYCRELDLLRNSDNYEEGNAKDAAMPATVDRRAHVQQCIPTAAGILGLTVAASIVIAAVWLRLRPNPTL
ncbi:phosphotransferase enzyme family protein [Metarhizium acridum CQMa 102]|uniref:Phosphotransferase enzyme family protein n=1 Tax=Metarhizium acridum (strain CQMa 102) TaxID=655827 RepID=E9E5P8_METAQ|nr:phosphotransferase enzyme family protein [Metarhizium acridum CQMa 102]EFY88761.1 phosphotransferase enzyme family protein [Metarhizium acridum CQMa 102]